MIFLKRYKKYIHRYRNHFDKFLQDIEHLHLYDHCLGFNFFTKNDGCNIIEASYEQYRIVLKWDYVMNTQTSNRIYYVERLNTIEIKLGNNEDFKTLYSTLCNCDVDCLKCLFHNKLLNSLYNKTHPQYQILKEI